MPKPPPEAAAAAEPETPKGAGGYRPWAELLARTFAVDMLAACFALYLLRDLDTKWTVDGGRSRVLSENR